MSPIIKELHTIAGVVGLSGKPVVYFLTSSKFGALVAEIQEVVSNPETAATMSPENCKEIRVTEMFSVRNSGSEDEIAVHLANEAAADCIDFQNRRARLITGAVNHNQPAPENMFITKPDIVEDYDLPPEPKPLVL